MEDRYLGDGLYLATGEDPAQIELYAHNGFAKTNRIFMEANMLADALVFLRRDKPEFFEVVLKQITTD